MAPALPESPWRRADVVVGTAYLVIELWAAALAVERMIASGRFHSQAGVIALCLMVVFDLLFALPGIGVAKGIRQGFVLVAILTGLGFVGSLSQWLMIAKQPSVWYPVFAVYNLAVFVFCAFRLRQMAKNEGENAVVSLALPKSVRSLDVLAGALNAISALAFVGMLFLNRRPVQSLPSDSDPNPFLVLGGLTLVHLSLCAGVALGRRWAFVLMELWLGFVLFGEIMVMRESHATVSAIQFLFVILHLATMAYCIPRSRKALSEAAPERAGRQGGDTD